MMGFFKSTTPEPAEVSKKTIQFCVYAILAVALAEILATGLEMLQTVLTAHKYGDGIFSFATFREMFWIVASHVLVVGVAALLAYLTHKQIRDAAVAAIGFGLGRVAIGIVPFVRGIFYVADSAESAIRALEVLMLLGTSAAAVAALLFLIRKWPAQSKLVV